jgi:hypothetical protein
MVRQSERGIASLFAHKDVGERNACGTRETIAMRLSVGKHLGLGHLVPDTGRR